MAQAEVEAKCVAPAAAAPVVAKAAADGEGRFSLTLSNASLPCMLYARNGVQYSFSVAPGVGSGTVTANITPLTYAATNHLFGLSANDVYARFDSADRARLTASAAKAAMDFVRQATKRLAEAGEQSAGWASDIFTGALVAKTSVHEGDAHDQWIDTFAQAFTWGDPNPYGDNGYLPLFASHTADQIADFLAHRGIKPIPEGAGVYVAEGGIPARWSNVDPTTGATTPGGPLNFDSGRCDVDNADAGPDGYVVGTLSNLVVMVDVVNGSQPLATENLRSRCKLVATLPTDAVGPVAVSPTGQIYVARERAAGVNYRTDLSADALIAALYSRPTFFLVYFDSGLSLYVLNSADSNIHKELTLSLPGVLNSHWGVHGIDFAPDGKLYALVAVLQGTETPRWVFADDPFQVEYFLATIDLETAVVSLGPALAVPSTMRLEPETSAQLRTFDIDIDRDGLLRVAASGALKPDASGRWWYLLTFRLDGSFVESTPVDAPRPYGVLSR